MKRILAVVVVAVVFIVVPTVAQQPTQSPETAPTFHSLKASDLPASKPSGPTISDAHRATYFKAQLQMSQAQQEFQQAQQKLQEAVAVMQADCGGGVGGTDKFQPQMGPQGDPVCVPKPEVKPVEKK